MQRSAPAVVRTGTYLEPETVPVALVVKLRPPFEVTVMTSLDIAFTADPGSVSGDGRRRGVRRERCPRSVARQAVQRGRSACAHSPLIALLFVVALMYM